MITIRRGSRVYELLSILAYVGEFPMRSIHLVMQVRGISSSLDYLKNRTFDSLSQTRLSVAAY